MCVYLPEESRESAPNASTYFTGAVVHFLLCRNDINAILEHVEAIFVVERMRRVWTSEFP